jgi:hypothetical protein
LKNLSSCSPSRSFNLSLFLIPLCFSLFSLCLSLSFLPPRRHSSVNSCSFGQTNTPVFVPLAAALVLSLSFSLSVSLCPFSLTSTAALECQQLLLRIDQHSLQLQHPLRERDNEHEQSGERERERKRDRERASKHTHTQTHTGNNEHEQRDKTKDRVCGQRR